MKQQLNGSLKVGIVYLLTLSLLVFFRKEIVCLGPPQWVLHELGVNRDVTVKVYRVGLKVTTPASGTWCDLADPLEAMTISSDEKGSRVAVGMSTVTWSGDGFKIAIHREGKEAIDISAEIIDGLLPHNVLGSAPLVKPLRPLMRTIPVFLPGQDVIALWRSGGPGFCFVDFEKGEGITPNERWISVASSNLTRTAYQMLLPDKRWMASYSNEKLVSGGGFAIDSGLLVLLALSDSLPAEFSADGFIGRLSGPKNGVVQLETALDCYQAIRLARYRGRAIDVTSLWDIRYTAGLKQIVIPKEARESLAASRWSLKVKVGDVTEMVPLGLDSLQVVAMLKIHNVPNRGAALSLVSGGENEPSIELFPSE